MPSYTEASQLQGKLFAGLRANIDKNGTKSISDYSLLTGRAINSVLNPGFKAKILHSKDGHNNRNAKKMSKTLLRAAASGVTSLVPIPGVGGLVGAVVNKVDAHYRSNSLKKKAAQADGDTWEGMTDQLKAKLKLIDASELDRARSKMEEAYKLCGVLESDLKNTLAPSSERCQQLKNSAQSVAYLIRRTTIFKKQAQDMRALADIMEKHADNHQNQIENVIIKIKAAAVDSEISMTHVNHTNCKKGLCIIKGSSFKIKGGDASVQNPSLWKRYSPFGAKELTDTVTALIKGP
ncbi:MAG: hypothetical protein ACI9ES_002516 [Oceanospirillaceae bacterium]|jgi:hypothetical protein